MNARVLALVVAAFAVAGAVAARGPEAVRLPAALLLVLVLPGFAIVRALSSGRGDPLERAAVALGLSLSTVIGGGALLAATVGLTARALAILLAAVTFVAIGAKLALPGARSKREPAARAPAVPVTPILALACALVVAGGAFAYARHPLQARGIEGYSALWLAPKLNTIRLGVISQELHATRYRLTITGARTRAWRIFLAPGERWSTSVSRPYGRAKVTALLYVRRGGAWEPYRRAWALLR